MLKIKLALSIVFLSFGSTQPYHNDALESIIFDAFIDDSFDEAWEARHLRHRDHGTKHHDKHQPHGGHWDGEESFINVTCASTDACTIPGRTDPSGVFVCRNSTDHHHHRSSTNSFPLCIPSNRGRRGDHCGCCGATCPTICSCTCNITEHAHEHSRFDHLPGGNSTGVSVIVNGTGHCVPFYATFRLFSNPHLVTTCNTTCAWVIKSKRTVTRPKEIYILYYDWERKNKSWGSDSIGLH